MTKAEMLKRRKVIEPNIFKMRSRGDFALWKRIVWRVFGKKDFGQSDGCYVEGYWFMGVCLITKFKENVDVE